MAGKREPYKGAVRVFRVLSDFEGKGMQEPDFDRAVRGKEQAERQIVGGEVRIGIVRFIIGEKEKGVGVCGEGSSSRRLCCVRLVGPRGLDLEKWNAAAVRRV
jgi:hypothetical protein